MTTRVRPRLRDLTSSDAARILELTRATHVFRDEELLIAEEVFRDCVNHPGPTGGIAFASGGGAIDITRTGHPAATDFVPNPRTGDPAAIDFVPNTRTGDPSGRPYDAPLPSAGPYEAMMDRPYYALGAELDGVLAGWICWGQTPCTEGTWDLYWMAVDPDLHGHGVGTALVEEMERRLAGRARLIAIDTSGRADYTPTRAFYAARGYRAIAIVPDFYAPGDDQVIFTKLLPAVGG